MKKIVKLALVLSLITLSAFASDTGMSSVALGGDSIEFNGDSSKNSSIYWHLDGFSKISKYGFAYGVGIDIVGLGTAGNSSNNYTMGTQLKLGYSLNSLINYPVHIKVEGGYGVTRFYDENYWGSQYGISLDATLYKSIGVGIAYKYVNTGVDGSLYDSYSANVLFLQFGF